VGDDLHQLKTYGRLWKFEHLKMSSEKKFKINFCSVI